MPGGAPAGAPAPCRRRTSGGACGATMSLGAQIRSVFRSAEGGDGCHPIACTLPQLPQEIFGPGDFVYPRRWSLTMPRC